MIFKPNYQQQLLLQRFRRQFLPNQFLCLANGEDNSVKLPKNSKLIGDCHIHIRNGSHNRIHLGDSSKYNNFSIAIDGDNNEIQIGDNVKLSGKLIINGNDLHIYIGKYTTAIGIYVLARDKSVEIGEHCMMSRGIEIRATDTHKIYDTNTNEQLNASTQDVIIGNHIWIAANVTVSKNVTIADGCIIGAGSFLNKSIMTPNSLVVGSSAKVVRQNVRWER